MIVDIINETWFTEWHEKLKKSFLNKVDSEINNQHRLVLERTLSWKYASSPLYSLIPFSNELNGQTLGKDLLKKPSPPKRYMSYGFDENGILLLETWDLSGDRNKFGFYANIKTENITNSDDYILLIHKNEKLNKVTLNAITEKKVQTSNLNIYVTVNGLKQNNWLLRVDILENGLIKFVKKFDPIFNLHTEFQMSYNSSGELENIFYNNKKYWSKN